MLYLDIGNSAVKVASKISDINGDKGSDLYSVPAGDDWYVHLRAGHNQIDHVFSILESELLESQSIIACSVVGALTSLFKKKLKSRIKFVTIQDFPIGRVDYDTPETLGVDRVLACLGALALCSRNDVIVVDAGTAVTIDLMDKDGVFRGGVIAPGLSLFEKGLMEFAPELPQVPRSVPSQWPPKSTVQAVQWGLTGLYLQTITEFVGRFQQTHPEAQIWITGGDAQVLTQIRRFKLQYHPNLVFEGLHAFLQNSNGSTN
jgi:type III pantothenate kinase